MQSSRPAPALEPAGVADGRSPSGGTEGLSSDGGGSASGGGGVASVGGAGFLNSLLQSSYERQQPGSGELRHDTEGWRGLETSFWARRACLCSSSQICPQLGFPHTDLHNVILRTCLCRCFT